MTDAINIDMRDIVGPDRILPCGCHVVDGAIWLVSKAKINTANLFVRPGRIITVDSGVDVTTPAAGTAIVRPSHPNSAENEGPSR